MMVRIFLRVSLVCVAAGVMISQSGCQYQRGSLMHPQLRSLAVSTFANKTTESSCAALLRGRLTEAVSKEPGVMLLAPDQADAVIEGSIVTIEQRRLARAKTRERAIRQDDSDAFQTVLYRLQVTVEYQVRVAGRDDMLLESREVIGVADVSRWPDDQVVRDDALGQALGDAATQIVSAITEAW